MLYRVKAILKAACIYIYIYLSLFLSVKYICIRSMQRYSNRLKAQSLLKARSQASMGVAKVRYELSPLGVFVCMCVYVCARVSVDNFTCGRWAAERSIGEYGPGRSIPRCSVRIFGGDFRKHQRRYFSICFLSLSLS